MLGAVSEGASASRSWHPATRLALHAWAAFVVICVVPYATVFLDGGLRLWPHISDTVGRWPITHILAQPAHSAGPRVPGTDFLPDFLAVGTLTLVSVIVAFAWSAIDRDRASDRLAYACVSTITRFMLATLLFVLNVAYDVNVKLVAGLMLAMAVSHVIPHTGRLARLLVFNTTVEPSAPTHLFSGITANRIARAAGIMVSVVSLYWTFTQAKRTVDEGATAASGPLYGIWRVEQTSNDGVVMPVLATDATAWRDVIVGGDVVIVSMSDAATAFRTTIDAGAKTIDLRPRPQVPGMAAGTPMQLHYSQPDRDHLELQRTDGEGTLVVRMRHIDASTYSLINHRQEWRW